MQTSWSSSPGIYKRRPGSGQKKLPQLADQPPPPMPIGGGSRSPAGHPKELLRERPASLRSEPRRRRLRAEEEEAFAVGLSSFSWVQHDVMMPTVKSFPSGTSFRLTEGQQEDLALRLCRTPASKKLSFQETAEMLVQKFGLSTKQAEVALTWGILALALPSSPSGQDQSPAPRSRLSRKCNLSASELFLPGRRKIPFCRRELECTQWEMELRRLMKLHGGILDSGNPLMEAAMQLEDADCRSAATQKAERSIYFAANRYSGTLATILAVATCRWWTCGDPEGLESVAPSSVCNSALRERRASPKLEKCMDAIVLLMWSLENLPSRPEFQKLNLASTECVPWIFPGMENYNAAKHFAVGTEMTSLEFMTSSRFGRTELTAQRWVYNKVGTFPEVKSLCSDESKGGVITAKLDSWKEAEMLKGESIALADIPYTAEASQGQMWLVEHFDGGKERSRRELLHASLRTVFYIENSAVAPIQALSTRPPGDEFLFPPLSIFQLTGFHMGCPDRPDRVTWKYYGCPKWTRVTGRDDRWPTEQPASKHGKLEVSFRDQVLEAVATFALSEHLLLLNQLFREGIKNEESLLRLRIELTFQYMQVGPQSWARLPVMLTCGMRQRIFLNRADHVMRKSDIGSSGTLYCGRFVGMPPSGGVCSKDGGVQCEACQALGREQVSEGGTADKATELIYCGRPLGDPPWDGYCGPNSGPQCEDCQCFSELGFTKTIKTLIDVCGLSLQQAEYTLAWGFLGLNSYADTGRPEGSERAELFVPAKLEHLGWEVELRGQLWMHRGIMDSDNPLMQAAEQIESEKCRALRWARESFSFAANQYSKYGPAPVLAVAACRWWTSGEEDKSPFIAPYFVINSALREKRLSPALEKCLDAVVLLMWALENLPPTPHFEKEPKQCTRVVSWIFPGFQNYDPNHFVEDAVLTWYEFTASSRTATIQGSSQFRRSRWVYCSEGRFPEVKFLAPEEKGDAVVDFLDSWEQSTEEKSSEIPGIPYFAKKNAGRLWLVPQENPEACVELVHAPLATVITIEGSSCVPLRELSHYREEDELLFPPLSRFRVTKLTIGRPYPDPDRVCWTYVGGPSWSSLMGRPSGPWPYTEGKIKKFLEQALQAAVSSESARRAELWFEEYEGWNGIIADVEHTLRTKMGLDFILRLQKILLSTETSSRRRVFQEEFQIRVSILVSQENLLRPVVSRHESETRFATLVPELLRAEMGMRDLMLCDEHEMRMLALVMAENSMRHNVAQEFVPVLVWAESALRPVVVYLEAISWVMILEEALLSVMSVEEASRLSLFQDELETREISARCFLIQAEGDVRTELLVPALLWTEDATRCSLEQEECMNWASIIDQALTSVLSTEETIRRRFAVKEFQTWVSIQLSEESAMRLLLVGESFDSRTPILLSEEKSLRRFLLQEESNIRYTLFMREVLWEEDAIQGLLVEDEWRRRIKIFASAERTRRRYLVRDESQPRMEILVPALVWEENAIRPFLVERERRKWAAILAQALTSILSVEESMRIGIAVSHEDSVRRTAGWHEAEIRVFMCVPELFWQEDAIRGLLVQEDWEMRVSSLVLAENEAHFFLLCEESEMWMECLLLGFISEECTMWNAILGEAMNSIISVEEAVRPFLVEEEHQARFEQQILVEDTMRGLLVQEESEARMSILVPAIGPPELAIRDFIRCEESTTRISMVQWAEHTARCLLAEEEAAKQVKVFVSALVSEECALWAAILGEAISSILSAEQTIRRALFEEEFQTRLAVFSSHELEWRLSLLRKESKRWFAAVLQQHARAEVITRVLLMRDEWKRRIKILASFENIVRLYLVQDESKPRVDILVWALVDAERKMRFLLLEQELTVWKAICEHALQQIRSIRSWGNRLRRFAVRLTSSC